MTFAEVEQLEIVIKKGMSSPGDCSCWLLASNGKIILPQQQQQQQPCFLDVYRRLICIKCLEGVLG